MQHLPQRRFVHEMEQRRLRPRFAHETKHNASQRRSAHHTPSEEQRLSQASLSDALETTAKLLQRSATMHLEEVSVGSIPPLYQVQQLAELLATTAADFVEGHLRRPDRVRAAAQKYRCVAWVTTTCALHT